MGEGNSCRTGLSTRHGTRTVLLTSFPVLSSGTLELHLVFVKGPDPRDSGQVIGERVNAVGKRGRENWGEGASNG